ncbi:MAG: hypothetical protein HQL90_00245 [Magnetococcales bacterium]|nr:hypothetical protein [Magnetococcales bacterium]
MSLIKHISSHDGRLGERPTAAAPSRGHVSEAEPSATQEDFFGHFFSTPETAHIRKKNQSIRDANDAVSLIQVADEGLDSTTTALSRMRLFSIPVPDDTTQNSVERLTEQLGLTEEIWTIAQKTVYNNQHLLNGDVKRQLYSVGEGPENLLSITIEDIGGMALDLQQQIGAVVRRESTLGRQAVAEAQQMLIDEMLGTVVQIRTTLDGLQTRFAEAIRRLQQSSDETLRAGQRIADVAVAIELSTLTRDTIREQAEESLPIQANQQPQLSMQLLQ